MNIICERCREAEAVLVMAGGDTQVETRAEMVCVSCCYQAVSNAALGTYRVGHIKGKGNDTK